MTDVEKHKRMYNLPQEIENVYTMLTPEEIDSKWQKVRELVPKRDSSLQMELAKQMNHERLRVEFATLANKVGPWIQAKTHVRTEFNVSISYNAVVMRNCSYFSIGNYPDDS